MATFLSPDWFDELARRLADAGPVGDGSTRLALGQLVTDGPGGEVAWTVVLGGGEQSRVENGVEHADVVLVEDFAAAQAIAGGAPPAELLGDGRVKLRGSVSALLAASDLLGALADALS